MWVYHNQSHALITLSQTHQSSRYQTYAYTTTIQANFTTRAPTPWSPIGHPQNHCRSLAATGVVKQDRGWVLRVLRFGCESETENRERGERVRGPSFHSALALRHRPPPMSPSPSPSPAASSLCLSRNQGNAGLGFWGWWGFREGRRSRAAKGGQAGGREMGEPSESPPL